MTHPSPRIVPVTNRVGRDLDHRPELVFDAYADVDQRAQWSPPVDEVIVFDAYDFQIGGTDHFRRGPRESPTFSGVTQYEHIVHNECIVFTGRLVNSADRLLAISLVSWRIAPSGTGARLVITDQTTSVVGSRPIEGARYSYELMLDRLGRHLASRI